MQSPFGGQFSTTGKLSAAATKRIPSTPLAALPAMSRAGAVTLWVQPSGASDAMGRSGAFWTKSQEQPGVAARRAPARAAPRARGPALDEWAPRDVMPESSHSGGSA
jgi:hypothetical protein